MRVYIYIVAMAVTTYLVRALPLLFLKEKIRSRFLRSFLHYVPVACLTAMTFPAILYATDHKLSGLAGAAVAVLLALRNKGLIVVAVAACVTVFLTEQVLAYLHI